MYIGPTIPSAKDWYQEKLSPTIQATDVLNPARGGVVAPQKSRTGEGSNSRRVRFRGGFLLFAGANSAASLRQHSIRYMVRDDRWVTIRPGVFALLTMLVTVAAFIARIVAQKALDRPTDPQWETGDPE